MRTQKSWIWLIFIDPVGCSIILLLKLLNEAGYKLTDIIKENPGDSLAKYILGNVGIVGKGAKKN